MPGSTNSKASQICNRSSQTLIGRTVTIGMTKLKKMPISSLLWSATYKNARISSVSATSKLPNFWNRPIASNNS